MLLAGLSLARHQDLTVGTTCLANRYFLKGMLHHIGKSGSRLVDTASDIGPSGILFLVMLTQLFVMNMGLQEQQTREPE